MKQERLLPSMTKSPKGHGQAQEYRREWIFKVTNKKIEGVKIPFITKLGEVKVYIVLAALFCVKTGRFMNLKQGRIHGYRSRVRVGRGHI